MGITSPLVKWLAALASILVLAAVFFPVFATTGRGSAPRTRCLSNIKQITIGQVIYSADHDDRFAFAVNWEDAIYPFVKRPIFCPESPGKQHGYAMLDALSGAKVLAVASPATTPFMIESIACIPNAHGDAGLAPRPGRHRGYNSVGYTDGHAKSVRVPQ